MTVKELAQYLGYTQRTIYNMIERGDIPFVKIGKEYRFRGEDIDKLISGKAEKKQRGLEYLKSIDNPLEKRLYFLGLLTKALEKYNVQPVLIGGNAVEFYTAGGYATNDIDIAAPSEPVDKVLKEWEFSKEGRFWINESLDILIEAPAFSLKAHQLDKLTEITIDNMKVFIIGVEDIVLDRLNAYVHWNSKDDLMWAREIIANNKDSFDWDYLLKEADDKVKKEIKKLRG